MGPEDLAVVGPTIGLEYGSVLQYLFNKYGCGDCRSGEQYFEFAVDEMRHLGWAANYVPGFGEPKPPPVPSDTVRFVHSVRRGARGSEALEGVSAAFYAEKTGEANSESLADDLSRAASQHEYHRYRLG